VGAGLLSVFNEVFSRYAELSTIIVGGLVLVVVVFLPKGLLSLSELPARLKEWRSGRRAGQEGFDEAIECEVIPAPPEALPGEIEGRTP
jgi:hypothetical protein